MKIFPSLPDCHSNFRISLELVQSPGFADCFMNAAACLFPVINRLAEKHVFVQEGVIIEATSLL